MREERFEVSVTFRQCAPASLSQITAHNGSDEQTFGGKQQVPHGDCGD
jgi:hypothetical protein